VAGVLVAVVAVALFVLSDSATGVNQALQLMGFDPDRAALLTALVAGALAAACVAFTGGPTALASIVALAIAGGMFAPTFRSETTAALSSVGPQGSFDPAGWAVSAVTLAVAALVVGWAAGSLAGITRRAVAEAIASLRRFARERPMRPRLLAPPAFLIVVMALLVGTLPFFADFINYDPDVHMRRGAAAQVGLVGGPPAGVTSLGSTSHPAAGTGVNPPLAAPTGHPPTDGGNAPSSPGPAAASLTLPHDLVGGPLPGSLVTPGAVSSSTPWTASVPSGAGRVDTATLPPFWTGGVRSQSEISIYVPPGYDAGTAHYPVLYEAPSSINAWNGGMQLTSTLDALITGGQVPPMLVVFVNSYGGPYTDTECANSFDGREWYDRFFSTTVVSYVDAHYRTIGTPQSRAILGFSQGGYCSATLLSHHPDVFRSSIVLSGYFVSGIESGTTPTAWRPFNNDPAIIAATSPMTVVPTLPADVRRQLFYVFCADPTNPFYGAQLAQFTHVLDGVGVPMAIFPTPLGHTWAAARTFLPSMLQLVAQRMASLGVFGRG